MDNTICRVSMKTTHLSIRIIPWPFRRAGRETVERESGYDAARQRSLALLREGADLGTGGRVTWSRDDLHERWPPVRRHEHPCLRARRDRGDKHARALVEELWDTRASCLSVQVLQEFFVTTTRKIPKPLDAAAAAQIIDDLAHWHVHAPASVTSSPPSTSSSEPELRSGTR